MSAAENLDGSALLLELLAEVRDQRAELRELREEVRELRGGRRPRPPKAPPPAVSDTDRAAARAAARRLGLFVRDEA